MHRRTLVVAALSALSAPQISLASQKHVELLPDDRRLAHAAPLIEFFSYACPHCRAFEPQLASFMAAHPAVVIDRHPVSFGRRSWKRCAALFHASQMVGKERQLTPRLFDAIHDDKLDYMDDAVLTRWLDEVGIGASSIWAAMISADVQVRTERDEAVVQSVGVTSIPSLLVNGEYLVDNSNGYQVTFETIRTLLHAL